MAILIIILTVSLLALFFWYFAPFDLWYKAKLSGIDPGLINMAKMRLQKIPHQLIISNLIKAHNSGLKVDTNDLMINYLAGTDIEMVTETSIRAVNAGLNINFKELAAQYLAKVDIKQVVHALITAESAGIKTEFKQLSSFYLSNINIIELIETLIRAKNAKIDEVNIDLLKEHYLSGGDIKKSVEAYIATRETDFKHISLKEIFAIDLADIDVMQAVNWSVNPKVVETPVISGIASDGIQVNMKLKLTLRANLKNIIGGATEQTVLARVEENLSTEIGKSDNHKSILKSPYKLAKIVEQKALGKDTAFDIISVDVSEVIVGKDLHAELLTERAKANAERAKAEYIKAEEKVQKAMAAALLDGNIKQVEKFKDIQNTDADTEMRKQIGKSFKDEDQ